MARRHRRRTSRSATRLFSAGPSAASTVAHRFLTAVTEDPRRRGPGSPGRARGRRSGRHHPTCTVFRKRLAVFGHNAPDVEGDVARVPERLPDAVDPPILFGGGIGAGWIGNVDIGIGAALGVGDWPHFSSDRGVDLRLRLDGEHADVLAGSTVLVAVGGGSAGRWEVTAATVGQRGRVRGLRQGHGRRPGQRPRSDRFGHPATDRRVRRPEVLAARPPRRPAPCPVTWWRSTRRRRRRPGGGPAGHRHRPQRRRRDWCTAPPSTGSSGASSTRPRFDSAEPVRHGGRWDLSPPRRAAAALAARPSSSTPTSRSPPTARPWRAARVGAGQPGPPALHAQAGPAHLRAVHRSLRATARARGPRQRRPLVARSPTLYGRTPRRPGLRPCGSIPSRATPYVQFGDGIVGPAAAHRCPQRAGPLPRSGSARPATSRAGAPRQPAGPSPRAQGRVQPFGRHRGDRPGTSPRRPGPRSPSTGARSAGPCRCSTTRTSPDLRRGLQGHRQRAAAAGRPDDRGHGRVREPTAPTPPAERLVDLAIAGRVTATRTSLVAVLDHVQVPFRLALKVAVDPDRRDRHGARRGRRRADRGAFAFPVRCRSAPPVERRAVIAVAHTVRRRVRRRPRPPVRGHGLLAPAPPGGARGGASPPPARPPPPVCWCCRTVTVRLAGGS